MSNALGPSPFSLVGAQILGSYVASSAYNIGRASRVRFWVHVVTASASNLTTITVKLQRRYNDGGGVNVFAYLDLPSDKGDKGTVQGTIEIPHVYTVAANGVYDFEFFLDTPYGLIDTTINVLANAPGIAGDSVAVYPILA